jgi:hypothetical protein
MDHDTCPAHGVQRVVGHDVTKGVDPYGINVLACGHRVVCLGPHEPNVILK